MITPGSRIFIAFDTETTGLNKLRRGHYNVPASITTRGDEVCQIGGLIFDEKLNPLKLFCHYCDTVIPDSPPNVFQVHGISQREVRKYLSGQFLPEVMQRWLPEFFYDNVIFIGYNSEFDMSMVAQTLSNSCLSFDWKKFSGNIVPKRGRYSIDIAEFFKVGSAYRKLSSFDSTLMWGREAFISRYEKSMVVETNCVQLLGGTWEKAHNAFYDALNTYLLWGEGVWKKKLL